MPFSSRLGGSSMVLGVVALVLGWRPSLLCCVLSSVLHRFASFPLSSVSLSFSYWLTYSPELWPGFAVGRWCRLGSVEVGPSVCLSYGD